MNCRKNFSKFCATIFFVVGVFWGAGVFSVKIANITALNFLENPGSFKQFYTALEDSGLEKKIKEKEKLTGGGYTFFVPTDEAMNKFGRLGLLRGKKNKKKFKKFVSYHLVNKKISPQDLKNIRGKIKTISKKKIKVREINKILYSVKTRGGYVYVINQVLIDPDLKSFLKV
jgi:uncharacterized surface protein with fasciclin (FAS1) repeats